MSLISRLLTNRKYSENKFTVKISISTVGEELVNEMMVVWASEEGQQQSTNYQIWRHSIVHQVLP